MCEKMITSNPLDKKILDFTFLPRRKINKYHPLSEEMRIHLKKLFEKDPFLDKKKINELSAQTGLQKDKIKFFFKNLRLKDYRTTKKYIKSIKNYKKFSVSDTRILEEKFRVKNSLDENVLVDLTNELSIKDPNKIKNWFAYRNRKMKKIIKENNTSFIVKPIIPEAVKPGVTTSNPLNQFYSYYTLMALDSWLKAVLANQSTTQTSVPISTQVMPMAAIKTEHS